MARGARKSPSISPDLLQSREARDLWAKLHADLDSARFLARTDHAALARYCTYLADWIKFTKVLEKEGMTYVTSSEHVKDMVRARPEVRFRRECEANLQSLENVLGLNPRFRFALTTALLSQQAGLAPPPAELPLDAPAQPGDAASEWERLLAGSATAQ
jgi:P27 family predicted phage terminase small subunit